MKREYIRIAEVRVTQEEKATCINEYRMFDVSLWYRVLYYRLTIEGSLALKLCDIPKTKDEVDKLIIDDVLKQIDT